MSINIAGRQAGAADFLSDVAMVKQAEQLTRLSPSVLMQAEHSAQELKKLITGAPDKQGKKGRQGSANGPDLKPPRRALSDSATGEAVSNSRRLMVLLAELATTIEEADMKKLALNAQAAAMQEAARNAGNAKLADDYDAAQAAVSMAIKMLQAQKDGLLKLINIAADAEKKLADVEQKLASLTPGTPEYDFALNERDTLGATLSQLESDLSEARAAIVRQQDTINTLQAKVDVQLAQIKAKNLTAPPEVIGKDKSNIERMLTLMSELGALMLESGDNRAQTQREILQMQQNARIAKMQEDAVKADQELAKAEAMAKAMGCVGKILGALVTIVGVIGAMFTGGASLVLAGIGLAIMAADKISQKVTGVSFLDKAMKPIMDLIKPLMEMLMNKLAGLFEKLGMDPQIASMVAMVAISIVIAVAVVALSLTGAAGAATNLVSKLLSKLGSSLTKLLEDSVAKFVFDVIKRSVSQVTKRISNSIKKLFDHIMKRANISPAKASSKLLPRQFTRAKWGEGFNHEIIAHRVDQVGAGLHLTKTGSVGGMGVAEKKFERDFAETNASIKFTSSELDLINDMMTNLLERLQNSFETSQNFFNRASEAISQNSSSCVAIARAIRGTASA